VSLSTRMQLYYAALEIVLQANLRGLSEGVG
jgi:hypothetical protein